jgi:hypothetical protein
MKFKKIIVLAITLLLLIGGTPSYTSAAVVFQQDQKSTFEYFTLDNLDQHQDVKDYIIAQGFEYYLNNGNLIDQSDLNAVNIYEMPTEEETSQSLEEEEFNELIELNETSELLQTVETEVLPELDSEKRDYLIEKYNLEVPEVEKNNYDQNIFVERNTASNAILNVWYLTYLPTDTGLTIGIVNIGKDPIDKISGNLKKYDLSKSTWKSALTKTFNKIKANSGVVSAWATGKTAVSDYFEYKITVTDNGSTWNYDNLGKTNLQRYSFDANYYNKLSALGGERHHFVSNDALKKTSFKPNSAPAIRMLYADHVKTPSWGSSFDAKAYRDAEVNLLSNKKYEDLLQMEVNGLKAAQDSEGNYRNLQEKYLDQVVYTLYLSETYFGIRSN